MNSEYYKNVNKYTKKDGFLALLLFAITMIMISLLAILRVNNSFIKDNILLAGCVYHSLLIIITIIFIKLNNQTIDSIGLIKGNWKLSIIIGVIIAALLFYFNCLSHIIDGEKFISLDKMPLLIIYFLLLGLCEEIVFRGYIGTRLHGLIKNKYVVIILTGLLFVVMHFPYRIIANGKSLIDLTVNSIPWLIDLFTTHLLFTIIYMKTNSLYGCIIPHWISDLAYELIAR